MHQGDRCSNKSQVATATCLLRSKAIHFQEIKIRELCRPGRSGGKQQLRARRSRANAAQ